MKWPSRAWLVQFSSDGRYCVEHATKEWWVAYRLKRAPDTWSKVGEFSSEALARDACELDADPRYACPPGKQNSANPAAPEKNRRFNVEYGN